MSSVTLSPATVPVLWFTRWPADLQNPLQLILEKIPRSVICQQGGLEDTPNAQREPGLTPVKLSLYILIFITSGRACLDHGRACLDHFQICLLIDYNAAAIHWKHIFDISI